MIHILPESIKEIQPLYVQRAVQGNKKYPKYLQIGPIVNY
jgi:hypothetical protein